MHCSRIMTPNPHFALNGMPAEPVSRTYQYRKIMKPMLERKRRARINKCLDELKDLMTGTLQADGENVSKLEKADILELTVRHLQRLRQSNALFVRSNEALIVEKFWAGFQHCAMASSQFLGQYDQSLSGVFLKHMAGYKSNISAAANAALSASTIETPLFAINSTTTTATTTTATKTTTAMAATTILKNPPKIKSQNGTRTTLVSSTSTHASASVSVLQQQQQSLPAGDNFHVNMNMNVNMNLNAKQHFALCHHHHHQQQPQQQQQQQQQQQHSLAYYSGSTTSESDEWSINAGPSVGDDEIMADGNVWRPW